MPHLALRRIVLALYLHALVAEALRPAGPPPRAVAPAAPELPQEPELPEPAELPARIRRRRG
jgi:hypothetical protein